MKIAPLAEVKDRLSAYIDAAKESAIVVTRNGKRHDEAEKAYQRRGRRTGQ